MRAVVAYRTGARRRSRRRRSRRRETTRRASLGKLPLPAPWTTPARRGRVASRRDADAEENLDRVDPFLKDNLLRGMVELLTGEPTPMRQRPVAAAAVNPAMPEEEKREAADAFAEDRQPPTHGREQDPGPPREPDWNPNSRKLTGTVRTRQRNRIPMVHLDPLTRSFRDQRRSNHHAVMPERLHLAINPISGRARFKANMQLVVPGRQSPDRLRSATGCSRHRP